MGRAENNKSGGWSIVLVVVTFLKKRKEKKKKVVKQAPNKHFLIKRNLKRETISHLCLLVLSCNYKYFSSIISIRCPHTY